MGRVGLFASSLALFQLESTWTRCCFLENSPFKCSNIRSSQFSCSENWNIGRFWRLQQFGSLENTLIADELGSHILGGPIVNKAVRSIETCRLIVVGHHSTQNFVDCLVQFLKIIIERHRSLVVFAAWCVGIIQHNFFLVKKLGWVECFLKKRRDRRWRCRRDLRLKHNSGVIEVTQNFLGNLLDTTSLFLCIVSVWFFKLGGSSLIQTKFGGVMVCLLPLKLCRLCSSACTGVALRRWASFWVVVLVVAVGSVFLRLGVEALRFFVKGLHVNFCVLVCNKVITYESMMCWSLCNWWRMECLWAITRRISSKVINEINYSLEAFFSNY